MQIDVTKIHYIQSKKFVRGPVFERQEYKRKRV
jgi:hypothetical protein